MRLAIAQMPMPARAHGCACLFALVVVGSGCSEERSCHLYFAYDADDDGRASWRASTLVWDEAGWPRSAGP